VAQRLYEAGSKRVRHRRRLAQLSIPDLAIV
jgi:hypothetical protein